MSPRLRGVTRGVEREAAQEETRRWKCKSPLPRWQPAPQQERTQEASTGGTILSPSRGGVSTSYLRQPHPRSGQTLVTFSLLASSSQHLPHPPKLMPVSLAPSSCVTVTVTPFIPQANLPLTSALHVQFPFPLKETRKNQE